MDVYTETAVGFERVNGTDTPALCLVASSSAGSHLFSYSLKEQPNHSDLLHIFTYSLKEHLLYLQQCNVSFTVSYFRLSSLSEYYRGLQFGFLRAIRLF